MSAIHQPNNEEKDAIQQARIGRVKQILSEKLPGQIFRFSFKDDSVYVEDEEGNFLMSLPASHFDS